MGNKILGIEFWQIALILTAVSACPFANAATFNLSSEKSEFLVGESFSVEIWLNTESAEVDGFDIMYLNYNSTILDVQDSSSSEPGIQVESLNLFPLTLKNNVSIFGDKGSILLSQVSSVGSSYSGIGKVARVTFYAKAAGKSGISFDFSEGLTTDTNVASSGQELLSSAQDLQVIVFEKTIPRSTGGSGGGGGGGGSIPTIKKYICSREWSCSNWSECEDSLITRECKLVDIAPKSQSKPCDAQDTPPNRTQPCTLIQIIEPKKSNLVEEQEGTSSEEDSLQENVEPKKFNQATPEARGDNVYRNKRELMTISMIGAAFVAVLSLSITYFFRIYRSKHRVESIGEEFPRSEDEAITKAREYITKYRSENIPDKLIEEQFLKKGWNEATVQKLMEMPVGKV